MAMRLLRPGAPCKISGRALKTAAPAAAVFRKARRVVGGWEESVVFKAA
jgi:hypothetical protein